MSAFEPEFWHHDKRLQEWDDAEDQRDQDERADNERNYGRLAATCLILAIAALTRSPDVVVWVGIVLCLVWLGSYLITKARDAVHERWARNRAQMDADWSAERERQLRLSREMDEAVLLGSDASLAEPEFAASVWADIDELGQAS